MQLNEKLKKFHIILGSGSPRRKEIFSILGFDFEIKTFPTEENYPEDLDKKQVSEFIAVEKAAAFKEMLENQKNSIVITADTTVVLENEILGKPNGRNGAIEMLKKLSGKKHTVCTGVCIKNHSKEVTFSAYSDVWFRELSDEEITFYVDNFKPFDKAGSYAVQEWIGAAAIARIEGSYYNVVGLPSQKLYMELEKFIDGLK
ncbi:MAG: septum formation protein Maf [Bacteroidales bacterium]|nr:septum formation protein Maf [Bacteroidales bacterium]MBR6278154.1 septum formation protein Maf [Bacteroidales bacterium]